MDIGPSLVHILGPEGGELGTGFLCHPPGYVLTCRHVLEQGCGTAAGAAVRLRYGGKELAARIACCLGPPHDLALLRLKEPAAGAPLLELDVRRQWERHRRVAARGFTATYPAGITVSGDLAEETSLDEGRVRAHQISDINARVSDLGFSGGPVVCEVSGRAMGVFVAREVTGEGFCCLLDPLLEQVPELRAANDAFARVRAAAAAAAARHTRSPEGWTYVRLGLEQGRIPEKKEGRDPEKMDAPDPDERPREEDHNREWRPASLEREVLASKGRYLLSSSVGMGKSELLRWLALDLAQGEGLFPVLLTCEEVRQAPRLDRDALLCLWAGKLHGVDGRDLGRTDAMDCLLAHQGSGRLAFLIDGLDQIADSDHAGLARRIFAALPGFPVLVASRPSAATGLEADQEVRFLRLRAFTARDQAAYFGADLERARALTRSCPDLARVPVLANMVRMLMAGGHDREVATRTGLYAAFEHHLVEKHREERGPGRISRGDARRILAEIQEVSCRALLADPPHIQRIPEEFFFRQFPRGRIEDLPDLGFLNHVVERGFRNEHSLWFTHQSFQEYLAARWIAEQWERGDEGLIDKVVTECWKPHLEEPLKFLAGLKGAAFIKRLYPGPACDNLIHARLFLAAACAAETQERCHLRGPEYVTRLAALAVQPGSTEEAMAALLGLGAEEDVESTLNHGDAKFRQSAVQALGRIVQHRDLPVPVLKVLIEMLGHTEAGVHSSVSSALGQIASRQDLPGPILEELVGLLHHAEAGVRSSAAVALGRIAQLRDLSDPILEALAGSLDDMEAKVRSSVAQVLGWFAQRDLPGPILKALAGSLDDTDRFVRHAAARALNHITSRQDLPAPFLDSLVTSLDDTAIDINCSAGQALGHIANRQGLPGPLLKALVGRLNHTNAHVRFSAASALGHIASRQDQPGAVLEALARLLDSTEASDRWSAALALGLFARYRDLPDPILKALTGLLDDTDSIVRTIAAHALGWIEYHRELPGPLLEALVGMLDDTAYSVRYTTTNTLGQIACRQGSSGPLLDILVELLGDPQDGIRSIAAKALERISSHQALPDPILEALGKLFADTVVGVRSSTAMVLGQIASRQNLPGLLLEALAGLLNDKEAIVRCSASKALGKISQRQDLPGPSLEALVDLLDDTDEVCRSAAKALEVIAERCDIPDNVVAQAVAIWKKNGAVAVRLLLRILYRRGVSLPPA